MWLLVQGQGVQPPVVGSTLAQAVLTATHSPSHSLWSAVIGPDIVATGVVTISTAQPEEVIALFLIDAADNRVYALQPEECQASTQPVLECDPSSAGCVEQWIRQYLPLISKQ